MSGDEYILVIAAAFVGLGIAYDVCSWLLWQWHGYQHERARRRGFPVLPPRRM